MTDGRIYPQAVRRATDVRPSIQQLGQRCSLVLVALTLGACSTQTVTASPAATTSSSPTIAPNITIHGIVEVGLGNVPDGPSCTLKIIQTNPVSVAFKDATGTLLATKQVTLLVGDFPLFGAGRCSGARKYSLTVPEQDLYEVEVSGKSAASVSLSELEVANYRLDVSV